MKLRFALAGLVVLSASLAACSSGTSCGFGCPAIAPTAPPLTLAGKQTQAFTYYYGFPATEPPTTITTTIAQTVTVTPTALASPFPAGQANDVHVAEVDDVDGLQTIDLTGDSYAATSGSNVLLYGSVENTPSQSSSGNGQSTVDTLVYTTPQIIDRSTETNGAAWTNKPGARLSEAYGDGHSENRAIADDGTYAETGTAQAPDGSGFTAIHLIEDSSGGGTYWGPFAGYTKVVFAIAAPAGTPSKIASTLRIYPKPAQAYFDIPTWYPTAPKFYSETDSIATNATAPHGCAASGALNKVTQKIVRLDTIIGYTETSERDTYDASGSVQCIAFSDTLSNFYDWNGDTIAFVQVSQNKKMISQVVTSEVITTATAPSAAAGARRSRAIRPSTIPILAIGALQDRFNAKIEATKRQLFKNERGIR